MCGCCCCLVAIAGGDAGGMFMCVGMLVPGSLHTICLSARVSLFTYLSFAVSVCLIVLYFQSVWFPLDECKTSQQAMAQEFWLTTEPSESPYVASYCYFSRSECILCNLRFIPSFLRFCFIAECYQNEICLMCDWKMYFQVGMRQIETHIFIKLLYNYSDKSLVCSSDTYTFYF